jgi:hypothetical protein
MRCVISVQTQAVAYLPNAIGARIGLKARLTSGEIEEVARHIADFSIAGIRALA